ncbi:hypothetical protein WN943_015546 [Citrus x changshan-huyou]
MAVIVVWVCEVVKVWLLAVVASRMIGWITLLLTQEFNFANNLHIWDTLLSDPDGPQETLLRVCCAMLILIRRRLLAGDFTSNLKLLQNYPPISIRHLLCVANNDHPLGQCNTFGVSFQCSDKLGLSLDLGSFIAGVMISTTNFAKHTLDQVTGLELALLVEISLSKLVVWFLFHWLISSAGSGCHCFL